MVASNVAFARHFFSKKASLRSEIWKFRYYWILTSQFDPQGWLWDLCEFSIYAGIFYQKTSLPTPRPLRHDFDNFLKMSKKCKNSHFGGFDTFLKNRLFHKKSLFFSKNFNFCPKSRNKKVKFHVIDEVNFNRFLILG